MAANLLGLRRGGRGASWAPVALPLCIIAALIIFTTIFFVFVTFWGQELDIFGCLPDGRAVLLQSDGRKHHSSTWNIQQFLSITLGFGSLSFAEAKGIDIAWDLLLGRGGQLFLSYISYPIFRRSLLHIMETRGASLPIFAALAFDKMTLSTIGTLLTQAGRALRSTHAFSMETQARQTCHRPWLSLRKAWNWRLILCFLAFAYVLSFPTWLSVMTGHQAQLTSYVDTGHGTLTPTSQLEVPDAVLHDGSRIGYPNEYAVFSREQIELYRVLISYDKELYEIRNNMCAGEYANLTSSLILSNTSRSYPDWSFVIPPHASCHELPNGTLSGAAYAIASSITINNRTFVLPPPPLHLDVGMMWYAIGGVGIPASTVQNSTVCEPASRYQWGFSSQLLFTFCILSIAFAVILTTLHLDAFWHGRSERCREPTKVYRDVLDLAHELRRQLGADVESPTSKLKDMVEQEGNNMRIDIEALPPSRLQEIAAKRKAEGGKRSRKGYVQWLRRWFKTMSSNAMRSSSRSVDYEEIELRDAKITQQRLFNGT